MSDIAATYVLLTCPRVPGPRVLRIAAQPVRLDLARRFTRRARSRVLDARIAIPADLKALDRNMEPDEVAKMRRLAHRMRRKARRR